jgi:hypothetical protein
MAKAIPIPEIGPDEVLIEVLDEPDEFNRVTMFTWWHDPNHYALVLGGHLKNDYPSDDSRRDTRGQVFFATLQAQLDYWEGRACFRGHKGDQIPYIDPGALKVRVEYPNGEEA